MSSMKDSIVRMANQIARNFAVKGEDAAIVATAEHIRKYWDPRMKAQAFDMVDRYGSGLSDPAREALVMLAKGTATTDG
jgi:formate dehydrogenase subunit delta